MCNLERGSHCQSTSWQMPLTIPIRIPYIYPLHLLAFQNWHTNYTTRPPWCDLWQLPKFMWTCLTYKTSSSIFRAGNIKKCQFILFTHRFLDQITQLNSLLVNIIRSDFIFIVQSVHQNEFLLKENLKQFYSKLL